MTAPRGQQHGAALLIVLLIVTLAASAILLRNLVESPRRLSDAQANRILLAARDALLGFSLSALNGQRPGDLMFPDALNKTETPPNYDGKWDGGCVDRSKIDGTLISSGANMRCLGRLPWRDLNLQLPDNSENDPTGIMPWYAVSANLVDPCLKSINPGTLDLVYPGAYPPDCPATPTNSQLPHPWLTVRDAQGNVISDRVAFIVMFPGPPIWPQSRPPSPNLGGANEYLDSYTVRVNSTGCPNGATTPCVFRNDDLDNDFILGDPNDSQNSFNDRLLYVTIDELIAAAEKRALAEAAAQLRTFQRASGSSAADRYYPYASTLGDGFFNCQNTLRRGHVPVNNGCQCYCTRDECGCHNCPNEVLDSVAFTSTGNYFTSDGACTASASQCNCSGNGWCRGTNLNVGTVTMTVKQPLAFSVAMTAPVATMTTLVADSSYSTSKGQCSHAAASCQCSGSGLASQYGQCSGTGIQTVTTSAYRFANTTAGRIELTQTTCPHAALSFPAWFNDNDWPRYIYYTLASTCTAANPGCGGVALTAGGQSGIHALVIGTGRPLQLQPPPLPKQSSFPSAAIGDYLDSAENTNGDDVYDAVGTPNSSTYNDKIVIVCPGEPSCL